MKTTCRECGKAFHTTLNSPQLFCSVGCQLKGDPLESEPPRQRMRSRAARTVRATTLCSVPQGNQTTD